MHSISFHNNSWDILITNSTPIRMLFINKELLISKPVYSIKFNMHFYNSPVLSCAHGTRWSLVSGVLRPSLPRAWPAMGGGHRLGGCTPMIYEMYLPIAIFHWLWSSHWFRFPCRAIRLRFKYTQEEERQIKCSYTYPARQLRSVLLPAPEGPIIAVNFPPANSPLIPLRSSFFSVNA